jgi:hypothetical protein
LDLETELEGLAPKTREFVQRMCATYVRGTLPNERESYKDERQRLKKLVLALKKLNRDCRHLAAKTDKIEKVADEIRESHIHAGWTAPIIYLAGLGGPVEFFRQRSRRDPALQLVHLIQALAEAEGFLSRESRLLKKRVPRIKALWKTKPLIWWQKGGLEYALDQIFRGQLKLTVRQSHKRIIEIRRKLDGRRLVFNDEKGYAPGIQRAIASMPTSYKAKCRRAITRAQHGSSRR